MNRDRWLRAEISQLCKEEDGKWIDIRLQSLLIQEVPAPVATRATKASRGTYIFASCLFLFGSLESRSGHPPPSRGRQSCSLRILGPLYSRGSETDKPTSSDRNFT